MTSSCSQRLSSEGFDVELIHRVNRVGYKAGALEQGLATARGEFICILDADFVPQPGLLEIDGAFFYGSKNRNDPNPLGSSQSRLFFAHPGASDVSRRPPSSRTGRPQPQRPIFQFQRNGRTLAQIVHPAIRRVATRYPDRRSRLQLPGTARRLEVCFPRRRRHARGAAGRHERVQVATASLDQRFDPNLQETAAPDLAQSVAFADQDRSHRPPHFQLRLLASRLPVRASASLRWRSAKSAGFECSCSTFPIFLTASLSVAVFYICAQRELYPRTWMKEILLLPALIALGVGLSINNARAVLEAVFNHHSEFKRTPKYGIEKKSQNWRSCRYMPLRSLLPLIEVAFAIYFSYFVWFAFRHGQYFTLPFLIMFQVRFSLRRPQFNRAMVARFSFPAAREVAFPA